MQVEHPNIVKFHKYWLDMKESQARVWLSFFYPPGLSFSPLLFSSHLWMNCFPSSICGPQVIFITEYMSSGSLKQFLKKTKKNHKTMNVKVSGHILDWCAYSCGGTGHCRPITIQIHISSRIRDDVTGWSLFRHISHSLWVWNLIFILNFPLIFFLFWLHLLFCIQECKAINCKTVLCWMREK